MAGAKTQYTLGHVTITHELGTSQPGTDDTKQYNL